MGLWKRIITEIIRRPFRTIVLAITIFSLSILSMMGYFLKDAVSTGYQEYINLEGYSIGVDNSSGKDIPSELIERILEIEHVVGYNGPSYEYDYKPVNFTNIPYESDSFASVKTSESITLSANLSTHWYSSFRNGNMILKEGVFPTLQQKGVMLDSILAAKNELSIGSEIELYNDASDTIMTFHVVGIYETLEPPEIELGGNQDTYYTISPSSYIFCDYDSFFEYHDFDDSLSVVDFYVDEYEHIETTYNKIKEIAPEEEYLVLNVLENRVSNYGEVIITLEGTSNLLLQFTYITSLLILFLMTLLWMRDHYYEAGIYIALGTNKMQIVLYFVTEILMIALTTLGISLLIGQQIISVYGKKILGTAIDFTQSNYIEDAIEAKLFESELSFQSLLISCGIYLLIVVIATLLSSIAIANYKPRKLFDEK